MVGEIKTANGSVLCDRRGSTVQKTLLKVVRRRDGSG